MGRDDRRRDHWGRESYYGGGRDRGRDYRDRRYERDNQRYNDRGYRYYNRRDRWQGERDRYRGGGRGGFSDREQDQFKGRYEIDPEELEYIRKREEVLKKRREEEENYVPEDVDAEALTALGLPTGFGPPPKPKLFDGRESHEEEENERKDDRYRHEDRNSREEKKRGDTTRGDHDNYHERRNRKEGSHRRHHESSSGERDEKRQKLDVDEDDAELVEEKSEDCSNQMNVIHQVNVKEAEIQGQTGHLVAETGVTASDCFIKDVPADAQTSNKPASDEQSGGNSNIHEPELDKGKEIPA